MPFKVITSTNIFHLVMLVMSLITMRLLDLRLFLTKCSFIYKNVNELEDEEKTQICTFKIKMMDFILKLHTRKQSINADAHNNDRQIRCCLSITSNYRQI